MTSEVILREKVNSEVSRFVDMARCFQAVSEKLWEHLVKGTVVMLDDYKQGHGLSHRTAWSESWLYDFLNV